MNQAELKIDGYSNLELIDKTPLSVLYRAIQESSGHYVALKTLSSFKDFDPKQRFEVESDVIEKVKHIDGVVATIDSGFGSSDTPFFVMPMFNKGSLDDRLVYDGSMSADEAVDLAVEVCSVLQNAHNLDVAHRDIKPGNIVLADDGSPRLSNFGERQAAESVKDHRDQLVGTPAYLAPEALTDSENSSPFLCDIYGVGATLWALIVGKPPYVIPVGSSSEIADFIYASELENISESGKVSPELWSVLKMALAQNPEDRYQSIEELSDALQNLSGGFEDDSTLSNSKDLAPDDKTSIVMKIAEPNIPPPVTGHPH